MIMNYQTINNNNNTNGSKDNLLIIVLYVIQSLHVNLQWPSIHYTIGCLKSGLGDVQTANGLSIFINKSFLLIPSQFPQLW